LKYAAEFFQQANKSILTDDYSYLKLELHKDECADGGWLLRTRNNDQVFAIFIDGKSRDKAADDVGSYSEPRDQEMSALPKNGAQAQHLLDLAAGCKTMENLAKGSLAEALSNGNFLYVYVNTDKKRSTFSVGSNILHMGGEDSLRFLSFFSEFYVLHRLSSAATDQERNSRNKPKHKSLLKRKKSSFN
jgi:hypothetical protein